MPFLLLTICLIYYNFINKDEYEYVREFQISQYFRLPSKQTPTPVQKDAIQPSFSPQAHLLE